MKTMKAAVWHGVDDIRMDDVQIPKIDDHECLLRVTFCGLCKTDVKKINGVTLGTKGELKPPRVFGHEIVGVLHKVGKHVRNWKEGDRVVVFHHVPCGRCYYCNRLEFTQCETYKTIDTSSGIGEPSGGGFGEFVKIPMLIVETGMIKIPDSSSFETAVFVEPTNCCLKGIDRANISLGDTVAILGQGPVGLTLDQLASLNGATVIGVDLVDYRLKKAKSLFEVSHAVNAARENAVDSIKDITCGRGVDKTIVAVEEPAAVSHAIKYTRPGGTIVFFSEFGGEGRSLKEGEKSLGGEIVDGIYGKELNVVGSYSSSYLRHSYAADIVFSGRINVKDQISHVLGIDKLQKAVDMASKRRSKHWTEVSGKVTKNPIDPDPNERSFKIILKI